MAERIAGIAYLKVDGAQYPLRGNFVVSPSALERTGIAGQDRVHGFAETPRIPFIEGDVSMVRDLSIEQIEAIVDATVTAELANGKVYVLREAWCRSAIEIQTSEGMARVRFEGVECTEFQS